MLMRAARLVVYTGLHAEGWSVKEAEQFYKEHFGYARRREVYRYMAIPGQGCSYVTGHIEIRRLRKEMQERKGDAFDIRQFHESLLAHGAQRLFCALSAGIRTKIQVLPVHRQFKMLGPPK
jgi:uncharacterized protein (DUF885 family)